MSGEGEHSVAEKAANLRRSVTVAKLRQWIEDPKTRPGARHLYGSGHQAQTAAGPGVASFLFEMQQRGFVKLWQVPQQNRPPGYRTDYFVARTERPWRAGAEAVLPDPAATPGPPATLEQQVAATFNRAGSRAAKV